MPSATFLTFDKFPGHLGGGDINLVTNTIKAYLSNTLPDLQADEYKSDLAEIASGNGYPAGGVAMTGVTWSQQAGSPQGIWVFSFDQFQYAASGGDIATARYVVWYALGAGSPNEFLIGVADFGSTFQITNGNTLTVTDTNGAFEIGKG